VSTGTPVGPAQPTATEAPDEDRRRAIDAVGRRMLSAALREGLVTEPPAVPAAEPAEILRHLGLDAPHLREELDDAVGNLALAYRRRRGIDAIWRSIAADGGSRDAYGVVAQLAPDAQMIALERLATEGHNLHPCGRTRLGWTEHDVLAYDQESPSVLVRFVAVREDAHVGDDVGALLRAAYPQLPEPDPGYRLQPVHPWQLPAVLHRRYADRFADGTLREVDGAGLAAAPTSSVRTLLLVAGRDRLPRYLKLSLDIQITSTRRSISLASTRNGPGVSALLAHLIEDPRVLFLPEVAGAALAGSRDASAIVRQGLHGRIAPGEVAVPGAVLPATSPVTGRSVLAEIVDRSGLTATDFLRGYAELLLDPVLRLLDAGIGLESHLQNSIPVFLDGRPVRMAFRDFGGIRINPARGAGVRLWPGSVTAAPDQDTARAKVAYTAFQAHLGEIVNRLADEHALATATAWRTVRDVVEEVYRRRSLDRDDRAFLLAPTVPHKALMRMRLARDGDLYVPIPNPMHAHG